MKTCTKCGKRRPVMAFSPLRKGGAYRRTMCQDCHTILNREYMSGPDGTRIKFKYSLNRWGLSVEQFAWMLYRCDFRCGNSGCRKPIDLDRPGVWAIDHDHGHCPGTRGCDKCIRGILCSGCNTALGLLGENGQRIRGLLAHLRSKHPRIGGKRRANSTDNPVPNPLNSLAPLRVH